MVGHGLILQPTYRIEHDRPVVHLFGKLQDGKTFLVRDTHQRPHFFILKSDEDRARARPGHPTSPRARHSAPRRTQSTAASPRSCAAAIWGTLNARH